MTRRGRAIAVLLVAIFVVATCAVLFARVAHAHADACGRTPVWAPSKPSTEGLAALLIDGAWVPAELLQWSRPDPRISIGAMDCCDVRCGEPFGRVPDTRAPPLA
jgi:hypothetical protein